jgi:pimeloyl-ACP methyl ester carboxylesterase
MTVGRGVAEMKARRAMQAEKIWEAEERRRLAKALPKACIVEVRNASHFVFISHPDLVEREIRAFLAGND